MTQQVKKRNRVHINFNCEYCNKSCEDTYAHYHRKKHHFCSIKCKSKYQSEIRPIQEHPRYRGGGLSKEEKRKRAKAREDVNRAIKLGKLKRGDCIVCQKKNAQAHHPDHNETFWIVWLCIKCHFQEHVRINHNLKLKQ